MKIVAACAWYEEPPAFLDRMVRSLAGHVDALVCLDGAWYGFEGGPTSSRAERDTIRAAAADIGLPTRVVVPAEGWRSQVEKRRELFRLAIHEQKADWVIVVDGDVAIVKCDDYALRKSLDLTDRDAATVMVTQMNKSWPYSEFPQHDMPQRHIWRGHPHLTVETAHNGIRIGPRWLQGDLAYVTPEPALDLTGVVMFAHDNQNRGRDRNDKAKQYRKTRDRENLEAWGR